MQDYRQEDYGERRTTGASVVGPDSLVQIMVRYRDRERLLTIRENSSFDLRKLGSTDVAKLDVVVSDAVLDSLHRIIRDAG